MGKGLGITRQAGDKIYIGDSIEITVESVQGGKVSLHIIAPADVPIHRDAAYVGLKMAASYKKSKGG